MGENEGRDLQLQQRPVGVAVAELLLTLLLQVGLEHVGGLRVVALEPVDDVADLLWPLLGVFAVHGGRELCVVSAGLREENSQLGALARTLARHKNRDDGGARFLVVVLFVCCLRKRFSVSCVNTW